MAKALFMAVHLINKSPHALLQFCVPKELWSKNKLSYDKLWTFDCEAYAHVPKEPHAKLDPRARKCIFVGYG